VEVVVREATADDYAVLCELFDEVDAFHRDGLPRVFQRPTGPVREQEYYRGLITDDNVGLFVAEVNEKVVGFVHARIIETPVIPVLVPRRYAIVDNLGVKSEFRGSGIGRRLMHKIHAWVTTKDAESIELNVYEFNQGAISFYQKLGYDTFSIKMRKVLDRARTAAYR
jgi:ribosomal protein S18 acetylase RimI-like enzyme